MGEDRAVAGLYVLLLRVRVCITEGREEGSIMVLPEEEGVPQVIVETEDSAAEHVVMSITQQRRGVAVAAVVEVAAVPQKLFPLRRAVAGLVYMGKVQMEPQEQIQQTLLIQLPPTLVRVVEAEVGVQRALFPLRD
jgi:membrane glycosyltransferase